MAFASICRVDERGAEAGFTPTGRPTMARLKKWVNKVCIVKLTAALGLLRRQAGLLGSVDLTPSDTVLGLVLAAALQRQCHRG
eukprot:jgi/Botrbrau1/21487/Bobra.0631s0001.2